MLLGWPTALSKKFGINGDPAPKKPSNATAKIIEIFKETP